jgi:hypothetical protein
MFYKGNGIHINKLIIGISAGLAAWIALFAVMASFGIIGLFCALASII